MTLVSTTCQLFNEHVAAQNTSEKCFPFPVQKLLITGITNHTPALPPGFGWKRSPVFNRFDYWGYNRFVYSQLADFVETDFVCIVHADGWAQHPQHWTDEFLDYDYIGAPFPVGLTGGQGRVGSGGFCIRSRKMLRACQQIPLQSNVTEDWHIGHNCFRLFEELGCRFAPVSLAVRFSIDLALEDYPGWCASDSFGFHDNHGEIATKGSNAPFKTFN
jgi:hypothetical protein